MSTTTTTTILSTALALLLLTTTTTTGCSAAAANNVRLDSPHHVAASGSAHARTTSRMMMTSFPTTQQSHLGHNKRQRRWNERLLLLRGGGATLPTPESSNKPASSTPQNSKAAFWSKPQSPASSGSTLTSQPVQQQRQQHQPVQSATQSANLQQQQHQQQQSTTTPSDTVSVSSDDDDKQENRIKMLIRILFLVYYGSLGSLMPYLPVYYHSLGHGGQIIGLLGAVKPFTTFLVAPVWGAISDQTHHPFFILQLTFLVSLVGQLLVGVRHEFMYIMFMVFLTALFNAPVKSLLDSMVLDHLQHRSQYGRLRLWGQLGFGLGSSGVGYLLSKSKHVAWADTAAFSPSFEESLSRYPVALQTAIRYASKCWQSMTGYKLLFLAYATLSVPTWLCIKAFQRLDREAREAKEAKEAAMTSNTAAEATKNNSKQKNSSDKDKQQQQQQEEKEVADTSVGHGLSLVLHNPDALLFFFLVLAVGVSSGLIENFAYVRIREVGGTGKEMGISRLVSSLAGAPMFWFSGPLSKRFGVDRVLVISLLSYVTRFVIYASMTNPFHGLPAEALRGVTFAAFWSSATIYAHKVSPPGLHATMLMLVNAMYGGLGQSMGAVFGGKLQHKVGTVRTFWYAAAADLCLVAAVIAYLAVRSNSSFRDPKPIEDPRQKQSQEGPSAAK